MKLNKRLRINHASTIELPLVPKQFTVFHEISSETNAHRWTNLDILIKKKTHPIATLIIFFSSNIDENCQVTEKFLRL